MTLGRERGASARPPLPDAGAPFALLDDQHSAGGAATASRLVTGFVRAHRCTEPAELEAVWARVEADQRGGLHAVLLADYDWGARLAGIAPPAATQVPRAAFEVLMFRDTARLTRDEVDRWLARLEAHETIPGADAADGASPDAAVAPSPAVAGLTALAPSLTKEAYRARIDAVQEAIRAGETYQVNFTLRLRGQAYGSPVALYRRLRTQQPAAYGALIRRPAADAPTSPDVDAADAAAFDVPWVLSLSPELFVRAEGGHVTARPMKGTAPRDPSPRRDAALLDWLRSDEKNRAENLMIVDLLRNDLGRVATTGSVSVPALFDVTSLPTVHQMTSTVQARLPAATTFPALVRALFPCGSITGAPKHQTMKLVAALEDSPRGLYTGTIGWVDAPRDGMACGDFCLSVAIRTLTLAAPDARGLRAARLGVGGGIVLDSTADSEWDEARLKARFATQVDPGFTLFETLRASRALGVRHRAAHLSRLASSAAALGFRFDRARVDAALDQAVATLGADGPHRLRLDLAHDGTVALRSAPLAPLPRGAVGLLRPRPHEDGIDDGAAAALRAHKTSHRAAYDAALHDAEARGAFDRLHLDRDGHVTEGARTNLFVRLADGRWATPPLEGATLPGTARARWRRRLGAVERALTMADVEQARDLLLTNALRGARRARLVDG